jgi:ubiquinone biosynthesis protein
MVEALDLKRLVPLHHNVPHHAQDTGPPTQPVRLRMALEELGPTFMKLGQMLATRADLVPSEYQRELAKLLDEAPSLEIKEVSETITAELGCPPERAFATFEATPLAAASIGQAHVATLHDGTTVVVKVRRPGAAEQIDEDLKLLHSLAAVAIRHWELARQFDVVGLAKQFDQSLRAELDYLHEGRNAERFAQNFADDHTVQIPRVFWETTTSRVLTLERLDGLKVTDLAALDAAGLDRATLATRGARLVLKMVFEDCFFHADLHPGNLFIEEGGRIGLIDFGMVGSIDEQSRETLGHLLLAMTEKDADGLVDAVLKLGTASGPVDRIALSRDVPPLLASYIDQPLGTVDLRTVLTELLSIMRHHRLALPSDLALLFKTVAMSDGLGQQLDPSFRLIEVAAPYAQRLLLEENSPRALLKRLSKEGPDLLWLATESPRQLRRLVGELVEGNLKVNIQPTGVDALLGRSERIADRLVLGMIVAALIVGLAVLASAYHPWGSVKAVGIVFTVATGGVVILGLLLAWFIVRSLRRRPE